MLWELLKFRETKNSALKPVTSSDGFFKTPRIVWKTFGELCQVSSPSRQVDDSYPIALWPVPCYSLYVYQAGSAVVAWCVAVLRRDQGLTAPGIAECIQMSTYPCVFVCWLPGLLAPVGRSTGSYFRFDDDYKTNKIYYLNHQKEMGELKTHSPIYCIMNNWGNMHNLTHSLEKIYMTAIL